MSIAISGSSITFPDQTQMSTAVGGSFRNRIINGDMRIDQRNAGASVTPANSLTLDRWFVENSQASKLTVQQNAGSVTPPIGFSQYLGVTSTATTTVSAGDYFMLEQRIEGYNVADLNWGTVNAKTVTVSFWVRSSLTGTFGGSVMNGLNARAYPFTYTISVADTWEYKTITIAGDTSGTWNTTNGNGMFLNFGLGLGSTYSGTAGAWTAGNLFSATGAVSVVGTNGATFYITGVQLEAGSTATDFERRPIGTELALCQRYAYSIGRVLGEVIGSGYSGTAAVRVFAPLPVTMRAAATLSSYGPVNAWVAQGAPGNVTATSISLAYSGKQGVGITFGGGLSNNAPVIVYADLSTGYLNFDAEL